MVDKHVRDYFQQDQKVFIDIPLLSQVSRTNNDGKSIDELLNDSMSKMLHTCMCKDSQAFGRSLEPNLGSLLTYVLILLFMEIASTMSYIYRVQLVEFTSNSVYESLSNLSLTLDTTRFGYKLLEL
jgi:hypothetical protein